MSYLTQPCESCGGSGRVKREPRRNAAGELDPLDILGNFEGLCDRCGGSGELQLETHGGNEAGNVVAAPVFWRRPGVRRGYQWRPSTSSKAN